jgi:hypothetical protein
LAAFSADSLFTRKEVYRAMLYMDALGVSLFGIHATAKASQSSRPARPAELN